MTDLSTTAAAGLLGISPESVRTLADRGVLPHRRTAGGHRRFAENDVLAYRADGSRTPSAPAVRIKVWSDAALAILEQAQADLGHGSAMAEPFRRAARELGGA